MGHVFRNHFPHVPHGMGTETGLVS
jgi:hypothetical protein